MLHAAEGSYGRLGWQGEPDQDSMDLHRIKRASRSVRLGKHARYAAGSLISAVQETLDALAHHDRHNDILVASIVHNLPLFRTICGVALSC
jgi:hypothetical protein